MTQMYVICVPLYHSEVPPPEQEKCEVERCPVCGTDMWVSEKKRDMRKTGSDDLKIWCGLCIVKQMIKEGRDPREAELVDILKRH